MTLTVVVTDYSWPSLDVERSMLAEVGAELVVAETGSEEELCHLAPHADAFLTCWKPVTARVLDAAPRCLTVARYGVGVDNIDVQAATELGIVVSNVPDFCTDEVADHTMALILALARHIHTYANQTAAGRWDNDAFGSMHRLRGRTLGLIGYGNVARAVQHRAIGFGMNILAYSPSTAGRPPHLDVRFTSTMDELLADADVVSLHLPATPSTTHLVNAEKLGRFKDGAFLVNTSRGTLIDEIALLAALDEGRLAGAGLDVLAQEGPGGGGRLSAHPRCVVTPHAAFKSAESIADLQRSAAANVADLLAGTLPATIVNPAVLDSPSLRIGRHSKSDGSDEQSSSEG